MSQIKYGHITERQPEKGLYRVKIDEDDIVTKFLPVLVKNSKNKKDEDPLDEGEHVACMMDDRMEEGVVLGCIYDSENTPTETAGEDIYQTTYADGSFVRFDKSSGDYTINVKGNVIVEAADNVEITCTKLKVTGDTEITGKLTVTEDIKSTTGDVESATVSLTNHQHPYLNVTTPATTSVPNPS